MSGKVQFQMLEPADITELQARPIKFDFEGICRSEDWDSNGRLIDRWTNLVWPDFGVPIFWRHRKGRAIGAGKINWNPRCELEIVGVLALDPTNRLDQFVLYQIERDELRSLSIGWLGGLETPTRLVFNGQTIRGRELKAEITEVSLCEAGADRFAKIAKLERRK